MHNTTKGCSNWRGLIVLFYIFPCHSMQPGQNVLHRMLWQDEELGALENNILLPATQKSVFLVCPSFLPGTSPSQQRGCSSSVQRGRHLMRVTCGGHHTLLPLTCHPIPPHHGHPTSISILGHPTSIYTIPVIVYPIAPCKGHHHSYHVTFRTWQCAFLDCHE